MTPATNSNNPRWPGRLPILLLFARMIIVLVVSSTPPSCSAFGLFSGTASRSRVCDASGSTRAEVFGSSGTTTTTTTTTFTTNPATAASVTTTGFSRSAPRLASTTTVVDPSSSSSKKQKYVPKWVKRGTLAESVGDSRSLGYTNVGLKGTVPVSFRSGNETTASTVAFVGQPIRDVASQAGQHIRYGCGKGECGTCECKMNGKWIRPCVETVPALAAASSGEQKEELVLHVKAVKNASKSSGTFFSIRSFFMGFWNNLLGMLGFLKFGKKANENWNERKAYEDLVAQKTLERKLKRRQQREMTGEGRRGGPEPQPGMA